MNRQTSGVRNIGMVSIIMIFAVLCLTVFSALSFVTAYREQQLTEKNIRATECYYAADWVAEKYYEVIEEKLAEGCTPVEIAETEEALFWNEKEHAFQYQVAIDPVQQLQVKLNVDEDNRLEVVSWKTVATGEWTINNDIHVWDGE